VCGELEEEEEEERSAEAELLLSEQAVAELEALLRHYETGKLNLYTQTSMLQTKPTEEAVAELEALLRHYETGGSQPPNHTTSSH
jgi:hypothetical protein